MKYEDEYINTSSKSQFVVLLLNKYNIKKSTAERRFYDLRKKFGKQKEYKYLMNEKKEPDKLKMMTFNDMKRFKFKITKEFLKKHGFNIMEINWLEDEGLI